MNKTPKNQNDNFYKDLETCNKLFEDFLHIYSKLKVHGNNHVVKIKEPEELHGNIITFLAQHRSLDNEG